MESPYELINALSISNGTVRDPRRPPLPYRLGGFATPKLQSLYYLRTYLRTSNLAGTFQGTSEQKPVKYFGAST